MTATNNEKIIAPTVELPEWAEQKTNLATSRLGAEIVSVTDDFFAPAVRMLNPATPIFITGLYDENGKWMDGWESRRKRETGFDSCIVKLAARGSIVGFDLDTSHFTGNFAPAISIAAIDHDEDTALPEDTGHWIEVLPMRSLEGNAHHFVKAVENLGNVPFTHLKVNIVPDGGLARLRVFGNVSLPQVVSGETIDLAGLRNGSVALAWSDAHFGVPENMLLPDKGKNMGDGWETRRRREPGFDWCVIKLAVPGEIRKIEIDTTHFKGNYPKSVSINAGYTETPGKKAVIAQSIYWLELLPQSELRMNRNHVFLELPKDFGKVSHIRLNIFPDGGISRIRLWGVPKRP